jgi:ABC-2 type transport system permease protein
MNLVAVTGERSFVGAGAQMPETPLLPMLLAQTRAQARMFWRLPSVSATALLMPLMLFVFFVLPHAREPWQGSVSVGAYMLASIGAYAVGSVMVFNFGVTVALDRGQKVDLLMRAAPLPAWVYLLARVISALLFAIIALAMLFAVALLLGGIQLEPAIWLGLGGRLIVGAIPFLALGFALAYLSGPSAAPAVANLVFIAMAFASGMLVRLDQMPDFLRAVAPYLPTYHYAQFAWNVLGVGDEGALVSAAWLVAYAIGLFGIAILAYRREARRRFA